MSLMIEVDTQGISDDWAQADGDFATKSRGMLKSDQLLSALLHLAPLDTPEGDDPCPPHIITRGGAGDFSFIGQGGTIFCPETDTDLTAQAACDVAFGKQHVAPPPPMPPKKTPTKVSAAAPVTRKRKFGWRGGVLVFLSICSLLGTVVMIFGVFSMRERGMPSADIKAAMTIGGGFALGAVLLFALARKVRRTEYYDDGGTRVKADGSALPFIAMAQSFGDYDFDDDGADYDVDLD
jgi:hypothetical protein